MNPLISKPMLLPPSPSPSSGFYRMLKAGNEYQLHVGAPTRIRPSFAYKFFTARGKIICGSYKYAFFCA